MVSTGVYLRVSTEEQAREGYSIRAQEEKLRSYAILKDWHIFSIYADEGISGKDIDSRPEMKRLITDVEAGKVNNVLVFKIDRLTRSTKNLIELMEIFNHHNCAFNSLNESIDTGTATGRMFLKIVGIFAEFERENLVERVKLGMERKVREGYSLCSYHASYGYDRENGNKIQTVNEQEAVIVRRMFDMYLNDDYSISKIERVLNAEQIPSKTGIKWRERTVKQILTNVTYIGKVRYNIRDASRYFETEGHHTPIIDEDTFYKVQDKLSKVKGVTKTKRPSSEVYFCGLLYCPYCGGKYTSKWQYRKQKDGTTVAQFPNYRCYKASRGNCPSKIYIGHKKFERVFEQYIAKIGDLTREDIKRPKDASLPDHSEERATIAAEISLIEKKTKEIMGFFMSGTVEFDEYQGMVKVGNERKIELEARLAQIEKAADTQRVRFSEAEIISNVREHWQYLDNSQRQQFLQKFIKKIVVHSEPSPTGGQNNVIIDAIMFNEF